MVTDLHLKRERKKPLESVDRIDFTTNGIKGNTTCMPLRQVLILPTVVLKEFNLQAADLRENITVDFDDLHSLPSGTILEIGTAIIRLTFHCEPCSMLKDKVNPRLIRHKRGYLGKFLNDGFIRTGDLIKISGAVEEAVPYESKERIRWFLANRETPIFVKELLYECGLPAAYARAIPAIIKNFPLLLKNKVLYRSHTVGNKK
jgi:MOSC domain-containing protein YiiM